MHILIEVDDPSEVGVNEKARYLVHDESFGTVIKGKRMGSEVFEGVVARVHPATRGDEMIRKGGP